MKQEFAVPSTISSSNPETPPEVLAAGPRAVSHYQKMVADGETPRFAEMCALQQPPGVKGTDRAYMEGRYNNQQLDKMPTDHARNIATLARRAGISISGKYYAAGLADHRGPADPAAWVDGTSDVTRVARERNLTVSGAVEHQGVAQPRPKSKPLSERLTKELMARERRDHRNMSKGELREMVVEKYGRKVKK